jgi:hypothetical protein
MLNVYTADLLRAVDSDMHHLYAVYSKPVCQVRLRRLDQADLLRSTLSRPRRIIFTNIVRDHPRR